MANVLCENETSLFNFRQEQSASAVASRGGGDGGSKAPMVKSRSAGGEDMLASCDEVSSGG